MTPMLRTAGLFVVLMLVGVMAGFTSLAIAGPNQFANLVLMIGFGSAFMSILIVVVQALLTW